MIDPFYPDQPPAAASEPDPPSEQAHSIPEARALTLARGRDLRSLLALYIRKHLPAAQPPDSTKPQPPKMEGAYARILPVLQFIPVVLVLLFVISFLWDFPGAEIAPFGYPVELSGLLRILSVSGLIGFLTNALAIGMLFHPRKRRPIFGQGLVPAQRERIIFRLATAVSEELINEEMIKRKIEESQAIAKYREMAFGVTRGVLEDAEFRQDLKRLTAEYVQQVLSSQDVRRKIIDFTTDKIEEQAGRGIGGLALRTYRFFNEADFQRRLDEAVKELPSSVDTALDGLDSLLDKLPEKIEARGEEIEAWATRLVLGFVEKFNVYDVIVENMRAYDEQQLENLLKNTANEQLNYIKYLGGVLGIAGGFVIWRPVLALVAFAVILGVLYGLDVLLYRRNAGA